MRSLPTSLHCSRLDEIVDDTFLDKLFSFKQLGLSIILFPTCIFLLNVECWIHIKHCEISLNKRLNVLAPARPLNLTHLEQLFTSFVYTLSGFAYTIYTPLFWTSWHSSCSNMTPSLTARLLTALADVTSVQWIMFNNTYGGIVGEEMSTELQFINSLLQHTVRS